MSNRNTKKPPEDPSKPNTQPRITSFFKPKDPNNPDEGSEQEKLPRRKQARFRNTSDNSENSVIGVITLSSDEEMPVSKPKPSKPALKRKTNTKRKKKRDSDSETEDSLTDDSSSSSSSSGSSSPPPAKRKTRKRRDSSSSSGIEFIPKKRQTKEKCTKTRPLRAAGVPQKSSTIVVPPYETKNKSDSYVRCLSQGHNEKSAKRKSLHEAAGVPKNKKSSTIVVPTSADDSKASKPVPNLSLVHCNIENGMNKEKQVQKAAAVPNTKKEKSDKTVTAATKGAKSTKAAKDTPVSTEQSQSAPNIISLSPRVPKPTSPMKSSPRVSSKTKTTPFSPARFFANKKPNKRLFDSPNRQPVMPSNSQSSSNGVLTPETSTSAQSQTEDAEALPNTGFYALNNLLQILKAVINDPDSKDLITSEDKELHDRFIALSIPAQTLYLRLYQRTKTWYRQAATRYEAIAADLTDVFNELHQAGFLTHIKDETPDLDNLLNIPNKDEMVKLVKERKLQPADTSFDAHKTVLLKVVTKQRILTSNSSKTAAELLTKKVLSVLGPTFKISELSQDVFTEMAILFSLPSFWDSEPNILKNQLLSILFEKQGKITYPYYKINKCRKIYRHRDDLKRFREALSLYSQMQVQYQAQFWEEVQNLHEKAFEMLKDVILSDPSIVEHDRSLPTFLRIYTAGSVLSRCCWVGVEACQKLRQYEKANMIIDFLKQNLTYLSHYRGRYHERKIVNSRHLKKPSEDLKKYLIEGLSDKLIRNDYRLAFTEQLKNVLEAIRSKEREQLRRAKKKKGSTKSNAEEDADASEADSKKLTVTELEKYHSELNGITTFYLSSNLEDAERIVEAEQLKVAGIGERVYGKSSFLGSSDGQHTISCVERRALQFYYGIGYPNGIHGEGAIINAIFGLVFWEILYDEENEISDAFRGPFQAMPLDFTYAEFYPQRKEKIDLVLHKLRHTWSVNDALDVMEKNWKANFGKRSVVTWSTFQSFDRVKSLVKSMGLKILTDICLKLAVNYRESSSGFPDLVCWNDTNCVFVEVKGPNDKLSDKQRIWMDYLIKNGAKAEICRVKAVSNKRIRV